MTGSEIDLEVQVFCFRRFGQAYFDGRSPQACILQGEDVYSNPQELQYKSPPKI